MLFARRRWAKKIAAILPKGSRERDWAVARLVWTAKHSAYAHHLSKRQCVLMAGRTIANDTIALSQAMKDLDLSESQANSLLLSIQESAVALAAKVIEQ